MSALLASIALLLAGAAVQPFLARSPKLAVRVSLALLFAGCLLGAYPALVALGGGRVEPWRAAWALPGAELSFGVDALSGLFLLLVVGVGLAAGVYGEGYLAAAEGHLPTATVRVFYFLLVGAMAAVVCARNAVLFLVAWEVMALAGFFLICADDTEPQARRAGLLYLVCTHVGTLCLVALFAFLTASSGSMDFAALRQALGAPGAPLNALFALALVGFGMKAGFMPLHVWLQEAHPAAPTHVSAVLSGVMIKMGIYGLLRFLSLCPAIPRAWGFVFLGIGVTSGILGVLFALVQHDLKRLLAYHSIENIGIIALGMGLGCLGLSERNAVLAAAGFAGAALHVLNHGLFKSLLFLGAGAYYQALGTRDLEAGGGLARRMPWATAFSWVGAAAICGLPPFNGFVSEWLIYYGFLNGSLARVTRYSIFGAAALALIGGLAAACFTKAFGAVTLGEPRSDAAREAREPAAIMLWPMAALAALCVGIGLVPGPAVRAAGRAALAVYPAGGPVGGPAPGLGGAALEGALGPLRVIGAAGAAVIGITVLLWLWRGERLSRQAVELQPTWGCGFTKPTPRMRYTASSYAQPLARLFKGLLLTEAHAQAPAGYFPEGASFSTETPDVALERLLLPAADLAESGVSPARRLQHGRLQYYLLYILVFLIVLLLWKL